MTHEITLGLDVGSIAIKASFKTSDGAIHSIYRPHKGKPDQTILEIMRDFGSNVTRAAVTGIGGRRIAELLGLYFVDPAVALTAAASEVSDVRHIIDIGGGSLSIVDLDEEGRFSGFKTNSLCAAGTGSFLDEQASRMNLTAQEKSEERNITEPPRIAARCAVFAKSDLIHRQQEGFSITEMWSGLCRGMVTTALSTLFRGRKPRGRVLLAGGVALNREVLRWLKKELDAELVPANEPHTFSASGAIKAATAIKKPVDWELLTSGATTSQIMRRPKLELTQSNYPSFDCLKSFVDDETEVRIHMQLGGDAVMGIDIGSTSTKAVIVNLKGEVLADMYRRTQGNPIDATKKILATISKFADSTLNVKGVGTTGSGRKMVGAIIGADRIVNEITAHATGTSATDPNVETIFEIGGQDAKFISLHDGIPHDSNMNYVCAAGTGSFVEEQASKLGFGLTEIGDAVMDTSPPYSSDRCTVFMEQDVHALIRAGFDRREVMGSVLYSVVQNYLNRVVGKRPFSRKKICFMGATARNKGLVAAFEKLLGTVIVVSPYCHVMGAFGVAVTVLQNVVKRGQPTKFRGLGLANKAVTLKRELCELCSNSCKITRAVLGEHADEKTAPSWGYLCGRDPDEMRVRISNHFDAIGKRNISWKKYSKGIASSEGKKQLTCGIPLALTNHSHLPFWTKLFAEFGIRIILSKPTSENTLPSAVEWIGADYCYPVKLAHGHVRELAINPDVDFIFLPYIVQDKPHDDNFKRSVYCPYNVAFASIIKSSGVLENDEGEKPVLSSVLNLQLDSEDIYRNLVKSLSSVIKLSPEKVKNAWIAAEAAQVSYEIELSEIGKKTLAQIEASEEDGIVVLGRPYNIYDLGANLNLPQKIADLNLTVLTVDMLPLKDVQIDPLYRNMYWRYGRKILQAATFIAKHPRLHAIYLTNFGCGPDSFLQTFVEKIMHDKPMMLLEIDEHSADAGYVTRLEAFKDVIDNEYCRKEATKRPAIKRELVNSRTLWLPELHPYSAHFLAAAIRSSGREARVLSTENIETFEMAKRFCRGTECVPAPSTIGAFLHVLKNSDAPEQECFFMPSAKGPCRFGQYSVLHRIILDEAGYKNTPIESWSDSKGDYGQGLKDSKYAYKAILTGDLLYKARCRLRPYVKDRQSFDDTMKTEMDRLLSVVEKAGPIEPTLTKTCKALKKIELNSTPKPLVGIVGEIYVRLNQYTNGRLVETIEDAGAEAWVAPISEWFKYMAFLDKMNSKIQKQPILERLKKHIKSSYMEHKDRSLSQIMAPVLKDRFEPPIESTVKAGEQFFPRQFDGESILTVGRAIEFADQGVNLIINCAPFGCMPGTLTAGIFGHLEGMLGIPIVSLFFDGESDLRHLVRTYIANIGER